MSIPIDSERCTEMVFQARCGPFRCINRAKYGDKCGVHDPERKRQRAAKRPPTAFERRIAAIEAEFDRVRLMEIELKIWRDDHPVRAARNLALAKQLQENPNNDEN